MNKPYMSSTEVCRLKGAIVGAGYSIKTVAEKLDMTRMTLSNKVNGRTDFTRREMEALARILGVTPSELFFPKSCV